jgi:hypothetical protein
MSMKSHITTLAVLLSINTIGQTVETFKPKIYTINPSIESKIIISNSEALKNGNKKMQLAKQRIKNTLRASSLQTTSITQKQSILSVDYSEGYSPTASTPFVPAIGRNFVGNNWDSEEGAPPDNSMAISNGGFIVSADNNTVDYRNESGDTLLQQISYETFLKDTSLTNNGISDPHVIYDAYKDRFIFVLQSGSDTTNSKICILFSRTNNPLDGWKKYVIRNTDVPEFDRWWFDYPSVAINKNDLFITGNLFKNVTNDKINILFQINKQSGYDSLPLKFSVIDSIKDANNKMGFTLCPLVNGLMETSYDTIMYMASTSFENDDYVYWYKITGSYNNSRTLTKHKVLTTTYDVPSAVVQKGTSTELLDAGDCRTQGGFFLNNKIHIGIQPW